MKKILSALACVVMMTGCAAHSPFILKTTADVHPTATKQYAPQGGPVLVVRGPLPSSIQYEPIALIDVGKVWYGGADNVLQDMANQARQLGADAVINVRTWRQPSGFAWAAPHGKGQAVKLINRPSDNQLRSLGEFK